MPSRRELLLRTSALLMPLPCAVRAAALDAAAGNTPESACGFAVARLRQGHLLDPAEVDTCSAGSTAPAIFQAASLAKPMVATLALKLALRGQLDLERPVSELVPGGYPHRQNLFALRELPVVDVVPPALLRKLTTRRLLSHTSGLPNWSSSGPLRLRFEPGTGWGYSGEGYVLVQHILQALTGQPLNALASAELFEPLGLRDCALKLTDHVSRSLVPGRSASGQTRQLRFPYEIAASSLYTSATDYARFLAATLADPRLLGLITEAPVAVPGSPYVYWGLGWAIEQASDYRAIWHWGHNPGFRALAMADLTSRDAVVALAATESAMPRAKSILRQALPGPHPGLDLDLVQ